MVLWLAAVYSCMRNSSQDTVTTEIKAWHLLIFSSGAQNRVMNSFSFSVNTLYKMTNSVGFLSGHVSAFSYFSELIPYSELFLHSMYGCIFVTSFPVQMVAGTSPRLWYLPWKQRHDMLCSAFCASGAQPNLQPPVCLETPEPYGKPSSLLHNNTDSQTE